MSDQPSYQVTEQVGHLIRKAHQLHTSIFQQLTCDEQLTPMQFAALCSVHESGPSSLTDLVKATAIDQATIRGVVNRLKTRELIQLVSDQRDQRKVIVQLTTAGEQLLEKMIPCAEQITEQTMSKLNPAERIALLHLLGKLCDDE